VRRQRGWEGEDEREGGRGDLGAAGWNRPGRRGGRKGRYVIFGKLPRALDAPRDGVAGIFEAETGAMRSVHMHTLRLGVRHA